MTMFNDKNFSRNNIKQKCDFVTKSYYFSPIWTLFENCIVFVLFSFCLHFNLYIPINNLFNFKAKSNTIKLFYFNSKFCRIFLFLIQIATYKSSRDFHGPSSRINNQQKFNNFNSKKFTAAAAAATSESEVQFQ